MMNAGLTLFSLLVLGVALIFKPTTSKTEPTNVLSAETQTTPKPFPKATLDPRPLEARDPVVVTSVDMSRWIYPKNSNLSQTENSISFVSSDTPASIFLWYRNEIKKGAYSVESAIQTQSITGVLDKIIANKGNGTIRVEISKDNTTETSAVSVVSD